MAASGLSSEAEVVNEARMKSYVKNRRRISRE